MARSTKRKACAKDTFGVFRPGVQGFIGLWTMNAFADDVLRGREPPEGGRKTLAIAHLK